MENTVTSAVLSKRREEIVQGLAQLDSSISRLEHQLEQLRANRFANQGSIQILDELLAEAAKPKADPAPPPQAS